MTNLKGKNWVDRFSMIRERNKKKNNYHRGIIIWDTRGVVSLYSCCCWVHWRIKEFLPPATAKRAQRTIEEKCQENISIPLLYIANYDRKRNKNIQNRNRRKSNKNEWSRRKSKKKREAGRRSNKMRNENQVINSPIAN